jgi:formylglycine-generating enzyme required for sulfatase activity
LVCERIAPASCADSYWAEWPIPADIGPTNYTDNHDGTVTDTTTGLMWQQGTAPSAMSWTDAKAYCASTLKAGGHSDWRLPTKIELQSLVDYGTAAPTINAVFQGTQPDNYWTAVPLTTNTPYAWYVSFGNGNTGGGLMNDPSVVFDVRCVR